MKKRVFSILLTLCMVMCLVPTSVFAAEKAAANSAAIQLNTRRIISPTKVTNGKNVHFVPNSYIYFGVNGKPIKWRVLDAEKACDGKTNGMFLLSEYLLDNNLKFNYIYGSNNYYQSDAQLWCRNLASNTGIFTVSERDAMRIVPKTDNVEKNLYGRTWGQSGLTNIDNMFFLSVREVTDYIGNYDNAPGLDATDTKGNVGGWWLRSPINNSRDAVGLVYPDGIIELETKDKVRSARPAFNLNKNAIKFISAAAGGKSVNGMEKGLTAVPSYDGNEWKLTLFDSSRNEFNILNSAVSASTDGGTIKIDYTGAKTGANEYISAMIIDGNTDPVYYYGRSMVPLSTENGTAELAVPAGLAEGEYSLAVFSEQYNGDYKTDYASNSTYISLTIEKKTGEQFDLTPGGKYYFDLSQQNIPGTINGELPDDTLHYVPFTYTGTVNSYVLGSASAGSTGGSDFASRVTEPWIYGYTYPHSLFIADYTVTQHISWDSLNEAGYIFGRDYKSGGIEYTLRAPTVGSSRSGTPETERERGTPLRNEWDTILNKNTDFIKNWEKTNSWGQDTSDLHAEYSKAEYRAFRGSTTVRFWDGYLKDDVRASYRPVLEVKNATTLGTDGLRSVTLDLGGRTLDGESTIDLVVKKGESFTAPTAEGLSRPDSVPEGAPLFWKDENGNCYKPGDTVPASVSKLSIVDGYDVIYLPGAYGTGDAVTDIKSYNDVFTLRGALFTRMGYTQTGWAAIDGGEKVYGLEDVYTSNKVLTLYPVWSPNRYTVTFDANGGTVTQDTMTITYGEKFAQMPIPERVGYIFVGWFDSQLGGRQYGDENGHSTAKYDKTENCTLYAQWVDAPMRTVTFDPNGGTLTGKATSEEKQNGPIYYRPDDPIRAGYSFTGWYSDSACTQRWDFNDSVKGDMTLYAGWAVNSYTITIKPENGGQNITITENYGTSITPPTLTKTGYTFTGWDKAFPTAMPAENMTITAQWRDVEKPTGEIKIGENKWDSIVNEISFDLFFKDTQSVTITAADNSGDDVKIEYLLSGKKLTEAELENEVFNNYTGLFDIRPDNEYIIYVRLIDKTMNVSYLSTDGIVLDGTSPVISGVENGKTYCTSQTVTIDEKHVDSITVNGTAVTLDEKNSFVLAPSDGEQKIVVTDKAGNTTDMTVTINDGHTFGEWISNGDDTHTRKCTVDGCTTGIESEKCRDADNDHKCDLCGKKLKDESNNSSNGDSRSDSSQTDSKKDAAEDSTNSRTHADGQGNPNTGVTGGYACWLVLVALSGGAVTIMRSKKKRSQ